MCALKVIFWNPAVKMVVICENGKYLGSIIDDLMNTCEEIIETTKTVRTNFNEKQVTCETKHFCILLTFLLATIAILVAVSVYSYLIKYGAKQKYLLPYHNTSKLKEIDIKTYYKNEK